MRFISSISLIAVSLFATTTFGQDPCGTQSRPRIEIVVDALNNLALVPEGTILPRNLKVYADFRTERQPNAEKPSRAQRMQRAQSESQIENRKPLVIAYAPETVFEKHRERSKSLLNKVKASSGYCETEQVVYATHPQCGSCSITLTAGHCYDSWPPPQFLEESFYAEVSPAVISWVGVNDPSSEGEFNCSDTATYPSGNISCYSAANREYSGGDFGAAWSYGTGEFWQSGNVYIVDVRTDGYLIHTIPVP